LLAISNEVGQVLERRSYDAWGRPRKNIDLEYNLPNPFGGSSSSFTMRGYTFHEHLEMVGLINMNGRVFDPILGRVLSPDNYIQDATSSQNFNRYSYCLNNPLKYTDPDGNLILEAMFVGGLMNVAIQGFSGNIKGLGDFGTAFAVGAVAGAGGAFAGGAAVSVVGVGGFAGGAAAGATAGAVGGFLGGAGTSWTQGGSFSDGITSGLKGAAIGAIGGALIGGTIAGVKSALNNGSFWNGNGEISACYDNGIDLSDGRGVEYSNESAKEFSDANFGKNPLGVRKLHADGSLPESKNITTSGDKVFYKGKSVNGLTIRVNSKMSDVYLIKNAFTSANKLYMVMGHEYLHAGFDNLGYHGEDRQHEAILKWEAENARYSPEFFINRYNSIPHTSQPYNYKLIFPNAR
jgi:RHS repeat-associated protein